VIIDHHDARHQYSDGPIEDEILDIVSSGKDLQEVINSDDRWPLLYHLSDIRRNLLEWYDFKKSGNILEIGAGCGALTGLFCEKLAEVTAVEISPKRAKIIEKRYTQFDNLKIYAGRLQDVDLKEKFDYISLIGVLEYAMSYDDRKDPYQSILQDCKGLLKEGGTLFVAIENRIGLKYWAGSPEDHTGRMFENLEGYPYDDGVRTFDRKELLNLLSRAGFDDVKMYYPWPDYKLPEAIFSDTIRPNRGLIVGNAPNYDQPRYRLFNEGAVMDSLNYNGLCLELANSFLAICRVKEE